MFFRILNGVYRHLVLPQFKKRCISGEQFYEEGLVLENIPQESLMALTYEEQARVQALFGKMWGGKIQSFKELGLFKCYNGFDPRYVSHYMYLPLIAHKLNNYHYSKFFEHKSLLGYLVKGSLKFPFCYVRCIDGEYYDNDMNQLSQAVAMQLCLEQDSIVVKDSVGSSGGKSVEILHLNKLDETERKNEICRLFREREQDFVIQECISQHPSFSRFNSTSINTLRVTTLYLNGKYSTLSIVLRCGKTGMKVDNWGSGGIIVGVSETGKVAKVGYDIHLNKIESNNGVLFKKEVLSQVPALLKAIEQAHKNQFSLCKFIGWDICFDDKNVPVVIELNSSQPGLIGEQLCTGPIFGDRTEEVLDYCAKKQFAYQSSLFEY